MKLSTRAVRVLLVATLAIGATNLDAGPAAAQADWQADNDAARRSEIIRRYREIVERRPDEGRIFDMLVQEVGGQAGLEGLIAQYTTLADADPNSFAYAMILGHLQKRAERFEEARLQYERARDLAPDDVLPWRGLGEVYARLDLRPESEAAWQRALELATDIETQREILRELADFALAARDWERAGALFDQLVALEPDNVYIRMELAETLLRHERFDDALQQYRIIADAAGTDTRQRAVATRDIGDVYMQMGRVDEAVEAYEQAMRLVEPGYWLYRELQQRIIEVYRQDDRLEEYVAQLEQGRRATSFDDLMLLASLYDEIGRDDDALEALRDAVRRNSGSIDARLALIRVLERRGQTDAVIEEYRALIRSNPGEASFRFRLIDVLRRSGDRDGAIATLDEAADRFAGDPSALSEIADRYMRFRMPDQAGAIYQRLVEIAPNDANNLLALGDWHFMEGRRSEAERIWRTILEVVEPEHEARAMLGDIFSDHGLNEEAILEYEEVVAAEPRNEVYNRSLAVLYQEAGRMPQALRLWQEILDTTDASQLRAEARTAIVEGWDSLGRLQDKVDEWRADFASDPPSTNAGYLLGEALTHLENEAEAELTWRRLLEIDETDLIPLLALERLYTSQNRVSDAIEVLTRIAEVAPSRARDAYHRLAELSLRVFDDDAAIRFAQLAVELNPDDAAARARLADVYRQMQRYDEAIAEYREAIELDARAFPVYFAMADVLLTLQRPEEAGELYRMVLAESGEEAQILRAGRRAMRIAQASGSLDPFIEAVEERLYDDAVGGAFLKLDVEAWEAIIGPMAQTARFGEPEASAVAASELERAARRALRPLLDALVSDDRGLRTTALGLLTTLEAPGAGAAIARLVETETDVDLRRDAVVALGLLGDSSWSGVLANAVGDPDAGTAAAAIWGLGRSGGPVAVTALGAVADDAGAPAERRALALVGLARAAGESESARVAAALYDEDSRVRQAATWACGLVGSAPLQDALRLVLEHGRSADAVAAADALSWHGERSRVLAALAEAWLEGADPIAEASARAMVHAGNWRPDLGRLRAWESGMSFWSSAAGTFGVDGYLASLFDARLRTESGAPPLTGEEVGALSAAIGAALTSGRSAPSVTLVRVVTLLDRLLEEDGGGLRAGLLAAVDAERDAIERIASEGDPTSRAAALRAVGRTGSLAGAGEGALTAALGSDDDRVVVAGLEAVRLVGGSVWSDVVMGLLESSSWRVRASAADALGGVGDGTSVPRLIELATEDGFATVRMAAWGAAIRLSPESSCAILSERWATIPAPDRAAAVSAVRASAAPCTTQIQDLASTDADARVRSAASAEIR